MGRKAGRNWLWDPGLAPCVSSPSPPPPSRIWASAQSLPAVSEAPAPRSGREQTPAGSGGELPVSCLSLALAIYPQEPITPFMRPAALPRLQINPKLT